MKSQNKIIFVINNYEFYLTHRFNLLKHLAKENDIKVVNTFEDAVLYLNEN